MPYIHPERRKKLDHVINTIEAMEIKTKGDLEFLVFKLMRTYMKDRDENYSNLHEAVYATIHAAEEFKRRFLDPREDAARSQNGDII